MMKHFTLLFLALLFLSSAYAQMNTPTTYTDDWITNIATIRFEDDKIYFVYPISENDYAGTRPTFLIKDSYYIKMDMSNHRKTYNGQKHIYTDLYNYIEIFEIDNKHDFDKDFFIRAAILEMIWSTYKKNMFTENTFRKLETLGADKTDEIADKAKLALELYDKFSQSESLNFEYIKDDDKE